MPARLKKCGSDGDGLDRPSHATRLKAASRRRFHDQRNVHRRVVDEESVLFFAVVAQRFTVIAEEDDQTAVVKLVALQPIDQAAQFVVGVRDLAVIEMSAILRAIRFRRIVRAVRIV